MSPLALLAGYLLLRGAGAGGGADAGGWRQLGPNSKGQYAIPAGAVFAIDSDAASPQSPILVKQLSDGGATVLPPTVAVTAMPIDWPKDDETRGAVGRMRAYGRSAAAQAVSLGTFGPSVSFPVRVWVKA